MILFEISSYLIGSIKSTSNLYESVPMYYTSQPNFLNCALLMETSLAPKDLLHELKEIEVRIGIIIIIN